MFELTTDERGALYVDTAGQRLLFLDGAGMDAAQITAEYVALVAAYMGAYAATMTAATFARTLLSAQAARWLAGHSTARRGEGR